MQKFEALPEKLNTSSRPECQTVSQTLTIEVRNRVKLQVSDNEEGL
jgi:hypothetical protein